MAKKTTKATKTPKTETPKTAPAPSIEMPAGFAEKASAWMEMISSAVSQMAPAAAAAVAAPAPAPVAPAPDPSPRPGTPAEIAAIKAALQNAGIDGSVVGLGATTYAPVATPATPPAPAPATPPAPAPVAAPIPESMAAFDAAMKAMGADSTKVIEALKAKMYRMLDVTPTTEQLAEELDLLATSGELDATLRDLGITPPPGWWSALTGWHNVEHIRTSGGANKAAGVMGLLWQGAAITLAVITGTR